MTILKRQARNSIRRHSTAHSCPLTIQLRFHLFQLISRPVQLYFGCAAASGASYTAAVLEEARRLVESVGVQALVGPTADDQERALQQYARRQPTVAFIDGSGAALVTDPAPNFFSFDPNAVQWMSGLGDYAYRRLGWRTAAIVDDRTVPVFTWTQSAAFAAEFCALGGSIVKRAWIPGSGDLSGLIGQLPSRGIDGLFVSSIERIRSRWQTTTHSCAATSHAG